MMEAQVRAAAPPPLSQRWLPPGPVAAAFEASLAKQAIIIGPVGSGKTTTALRKAAGLAHRLPAIPDTLAAPGVMVKRCRVVIVARTYRVMWKNLLPSYFKVFEKTWGKWTGGEGEPWVHKFRLRVPGQNLILDMQLDGLAVGDTPLDDLTRGLETTAAYIYEFDTLPEDTIEKFQSRCGRYPNMPSGAEQDQVHAVAQVWADANAFDPDHWAWEACFGEGKLAGREVFLQPGGRTPQAENIQNVGRLYYPNLIATMKAWQVARLIDNKFVPDRPGFVVHNDWNPLLHQSPVPLEADPYLPLIIGLDQGPNCAAIIYQRKRRRVWRALAELCAPKDGGWTAKRMADNLTDFLAQNYPRHAVLAIADPASKANSGVSGGEDAALTWFKEFCDNFPYPVTIALSNKLKGIDGRINAVAEVLQHQDGGEQGLLVSSVCRVYLRGFNGAYRWKAKPKEPGVASNEIDKNYEANAQDAGQYPIHTIEAAPEYLDQAMGSRAILERGASGAPRAIEIML